MVIQITQIATYLEHKTYVVMVMIIFHLMIVHLVVLQLGLALKEVVNCYCMYMCMCVYVYQYRYMYVRT